MKIVWHEDPTMDEDEVHIYGRKEYLDPVVLQQVLLQTLPQEIKVFKRDQELYLALSSILFFETEGRTIVVHTKDDCYVVKYKLYELEQLLPSNFHRVSKSSIVNFQKIMSLTRTVVSNTVIEFKDCHKVVSVSRMYFKEVKEEMSRRRNSL